MLATRESIATFIKGKVATDLAGITTPDIKFSVRASNQPPDSVNCLNMYFYDDNIAEGGLRTNPAYRQLTASLELLIQCDPNEPLKAENEAYRVCHLINQFMALQAIEKMDYSTSPATSLRSGISWRESYPLEWNSSQAEDMRYIWKTSSVLFRYFEEAVTV